MFYPVTTQQSGGAGACGAERSQKLVKSLVRTAFRGEPLFRSPRPDFIETMSASGSCLASNYCSGLQDRTSLRRCGYGVQNAYCLRELFRSPRPDFIETLLAGIGTTEISYRLFRSPRPDFIETFPFLEYKMWPSPIVPVSKTGLH